MAFIWFWTTFILENIIKSLSIPASFNYDFRARACSQKVVSLSDPSVTVLNVTTFIPKSILRVTYLAVNWVSQNSCGALSTLSSSWWAISGKWTENNLRHILALLRIIPLNRRHEELTAVMSFAWNPSWVKICSRISSGSDKSDIFSSNWKFWRLRNWTLCNRVAALLL